MGERRQAVAEDAHIDVQAGLHIPLSKEGAEIQKSVSRPEQSRTPAGYNRKFLDFYRPNTTFYLSPEERAHLWQVGKPQIAEQPAGTYAKQILEGLPILRTSE